jgi:tRNA G10  N-methylase Trm11
MTENLFRSKLEDLMPAEELDFPPTPGFGPWSVLFSEKVRAFPAKANLHLLSFLIRKYSEPGSVVVDPMAGTYSTCVMAALLGRVGIGVEIEEEYYRWGLETKERVERAGSLGQRGEMVVMRGDARKLAEILKHVKGHVTLVLFSPPYGDTNLSGGDISKRLERLVTAGYDPKDYIHGEGSNAILRHYGMDRPSEGNIGWLPLGNPELLEPEAKSLQHLYRRLLGSRGRPTYLSEMLLVYHNCHQLLRDGGRLAVIVKPYLRERRVVDIPHITRLLLERCGFALEAVYKLRLQGQSLWRHLHYRHDPDLPRIMHEYVLVCRKPPV